MPLVKSDVNDCMALAVAVFPQFPLERSLIEGYYELLKDLNCSKTELFEAVKEVLRTSTWFPTVAAIREEILRKPTYTAPAFDAKELTNSKAVPMPDYVKDLRDSLKESLPSHPVSEAFGEFIDSTRIAPDSESVSVEK